MSDLKSILQSLKPKKQSTGKSCRHCQGENRRSAKVCIHCSQCFPECVWCGGVLFYDQNPCEKCGAVFCSYVK